MDHLPKPTIAISSLEFQYHSPAAYYQSGILEWNRYPAEQGWDASLIQARDIRESLNGRSLDELLVFLQSWLYFGLLSTILETRISTCKFICSKPTGEQIINTQHLLPHIQMWARTVDARRSKDDSFMQMELDEKSNVLNSAAPFITALQALSTSEYESLAMIGVSVALLATALGNAVIQVYNDVDDALDVPQFQFGFGGMPLRNRMLKLSWCPSDILRLTKNSLVPGICYGSMIAREERSITHEKCSDFACVANNIEKGTYVPQHYPPLVHCDCQFIGLPDWSAEHILENGGIPLVRLWQPEDGNEQRRFDVIRYESNIHYTALSHVWSDGLGDEYGNKIACCQYDRISALLTSITAMEADRDVVQSGSWSPLFWLDTLCVPHTNEHRRLACQRMAESYERAEYVLVLDSELQRWDFHGGSDEEALLRISVCGWMRRVWTLSEGVLAKHLIVKFADSLFDVSEAVDRIRKRSVGYPGCLDTVPREMCGFFRSMKRVSSATLGERFQNAWLATQTRQTSHAGDEIISTGIMLRFDVAPLFDIKTDMRLRMQSFLSMFQVLPRGVLFSMIPRLRTPGFRWGPSSLHGGSIFSSTGVDNSLHRNPNGVEIEAFGVFLDGKWRDPDTQPWLFQENQQRHWYKIIPWGLWHKHHLFVKQEDILQDEKALQTTRLALVVNTRDVLLGSMAVLASHVTEEFGTIHCLFQRTVMILPADNHGNPTFGPSGLNNEIYGPTECIGSWSNRPRRWCIG
jgi:hypothetical protein